MSKPLQGYCQVCMVENIELEFTCPHCSTGRCKKCNNIVKIQGIDKCLNSLCEIPKKTAKENKAEIQRLRANTQKELKERTKLANIGGFFFLSGMVVMLGIGLLTELDFAWALVIGGGMMFIGLMLSQQETLEELHGILKDLDRVEEDVDLLEAYEELLEMDKKSLREESRENLKDWNRE